MKKLINLILIFCAINLISCASNQVQNSEEDYSEEYDYSIEKDIEQPQTTDNFLGDFDPIEMPPLMFLTKSRSKVNPKEVKNVHLIPRTNNVELRFRNGANDITIILDSAERNKIFEACETFLQQYEDKTIPHHKVNNKTAYFNSKCSLWYGVITGGNGCTKNDYYVNCEFIDKRPYLLLKCQPTRCDDEKSFTPKVSLYMSPTQIKTFMEVMKQETLNELLTNLKEKAYTY